MAADGDLFDRVSVAEYWFKLFYAYETIYCVCAFAAKLSILLFYSRIFKERRFIFWLRVLVAVVIMHYLSGQIVVIFECWPIPALWDPTVTGTCINLVPFFVATGALNTFIDTAILLLPLPMIWSLEIDRQHKLALSGVFLLGSFVVAAAIVRTIYLSQVVIVDITYEFVNSALWTAAEPSIAVTSASLPILRSLWIWNRRKRTGRYGTMSPDSYEEDTKMRSGGGYGGPGGRHAAFRKQASLESQKYPLTDLPAGAQQVFGNRVTVASNGQSRKLSDETDAYADLPIMHPQEAARAYHKQEPPLPPLPPHAGRPAEPPTYAYSQRSSANTGIPSNRSELYG